MNDVAAGALGGALIAYGLVLTSNYRGWRDRGVALNVRARSRFWLRPERQASARANLRLALVGWGVIAILAGIALFASVVVALVS